MSVIIHPHHFSGTVRIPASKSHTVRRLLLAALAEGVSEIKYPLDSLDTRSCVSVCRALGAEITEIRGADPASPNPKDGKDESLISYMVKGKGHRSLPGIPVSCNVGNSGTTLYLSLAAAALGTETVEFDGDEQIRRRSAGPLLGALTGLGIEINSVPGGFAPLSVRGPWKGGRVSISCTTSQYLSPLLLAAPLAPPGIITEIDVPLLNERPYIEITLSYLKAQKISFDMKDDFSYFRIPGGAAYKPMNGPVPGDFSSAAFPACSAVVTGGDLTLLGLDPDDTQGDKEFFVILEKMGCQVKWEPVTRGSNSEWQLRIFREGPLRGGEFDLNATPDMLPVMAVLGVYAQGETSLVNAAHARIKETDRIAVMAKELGKLGVKVEERPDGIVIHGTGGTGTAFRGKVDSHGDHRVAMALAAGALGAGGDVEITGAESADVSYPGFLKLLEAEVIMKTLTFPYGKESLTVEIPEHRYKGEMVSGLHSYHPEKSEEELVDDALANPVGTAPLHVLAEGKKKVVLIASDHTRPVPSRIIVPRLLAEIRKGNPEAEITILIATGCHRASSKAELEYKFGADILNTEKIILHDCDSPDMVNIGKLPSGGDMIINRMVMEADLLAAEGFIEPHFFAGFSGGRKSIFPGVASRKTVVYNHNAEFIAHPRARTGILDGNPIHIDMLHAARSAALAFICNVVINADKKIIYASAGDCDAAHRKGTGFLSSRCAVKAVPADIVITTNGGYPLDQNIYQAVKGMTAAEAVVKKDGVIIMLAKSDDGHGAPEFYKTFAEEKDIDRMLDIFMKTPKEATRIDQWQSQIFARVLKHARVIYVSDAPDRMVQDMHMMPAHSISEAIKKAEEILGNPQAAIAAIPDGVAIMALP